MSEAKATKTIHWGELSTRAENEPISYDFPNDEAASAFLEGIEFGLYQFPETPECEDGDLNEYGTQEERDAFLLGLSESDGYTDYEELIANDVDTNDAAEDNG